MRKFVLILLPALLLAQDPDDAGSPKTAVAAPSTSAIEAGKAQFRQTCGFCHGQDGRGGASGPDLIRSATVSHDVGGDVIGQVVHAGRPAQGMPAFQLPDSAIAQIAAFLHSEANAAASVARKVPVDYPLQKLLVGNAEQGHAYFQANCATCHSVTGDLSHVATKYKPFDLQTKIAFPAGAKPALSVRTGAGEEFHGEEVYADEFWVALKDKNGWTHTWKRSQVQVHEDDPLAGHVKLLHRMSDGNLHDVFAFLETLK